MPDNDPLGILKNNNTTVADNTGDPLGILKKKPSTSVGGTTSNTGSQTASPQINGFQNLKNAFDNFHLPERQPSIYGEDTGMKPVDVAANKAQEKKTAKQAATNNAHEYFDNNKNLLEQLAKNNPDLLQKDEEGKPIKGEYNLKKLEQTSIFNKKVNEILDAYTKGNLALTKYQNGEKIGQPIFSKPEGFWQSFGNSIANSFKQTKDAIVTKFKSPKEIADYFDEQRSKLPDVPESVPTGYGSMAGNALGGMIKPAVEFGIGEEIFPGGGGLITAASDIIPTNTSEKTKEIYYDRMNALEQQYGKGKVPENERLDAIHKALSQAPLQALPNEAMQLYLFGKGGNAANNLALKSFKKTLGSAGLDVTKMGLLGGTSEIATQGIKQLQSGDGKFDENISEAAGNWALMEAAFKALPVTSKAIGVTYSKLMNSQAKNVLATADPEVVQKLSDEAVQKGWLTQEQADAALKDVQDFANIKKTIPESVPEDKAASVAGLIQKNQNLEAEKKTTNKIFHDDIDAEIKNNEQKTKQILNSNTPLKYETDELTGERAQSIGGRPKNEKTEKVEEKPNDEGTIISQPEQQLSNESSKEQENVGEVVQPQQSEIEQLPNKTDNSVVNDAEYKDFIDKGKVTPERLNDIADKVKNQKPLSDREKEIFTDKTADINKIIASEKPKENNSIVENKQGISKEEFHNNILDMAERMKDSSFDWRLNIPEMSQKDREKAVNDIRNGKESAAAKKLQAWIDNAYEKNIITLNRGRGDNAQTIQFPLKEWFGEPLDHAEIEAALKHLDDNAVSIINDEGINSNNIDNLKHLFNGFPYTEKDFNEVKNYLARQDKGNAENKSIDTQSEAKKINPSLQQNNQDAIRINRPEGEISHTGSTGENISESSAGVRPSQQRIEPTRTRQEEESINTSEEKVDIYSELPPTILSHRGLQEAATEHGLSDVEKRNRKSDIKLRRDADNTIAEWKEQGTYSKNINELLDETEKGRVPNDEERLILQDHLANVRQQLRDIQNNKGILSKEYTDKLNELERIKNIGQSARSEAGAALRVGGNASVPDESLEGYLLQEKDLNKGAELTDSQKLQTQKEFEKISDAENEYKKKYEDLQEQYAKLQAEKEIKKTASTIKKNPKKTHDDFVKERNEIVNHLREKLKAARQETSVTVLPYAKELIAIAPDVAKLAKSLIEEGVTKLEDVVKNIHTQLKEDIADLKEKDVHDILAGVYNEKKKTRSEVAEQMQNLKIQAQLVNKYEALLKGEEPKNEKARIKRNQEIHDLREKIIGLKKENIEANKFYGESDRGNRKIEKLEDELQRLKERKPKEQSEKQQREISDSEKELKEQIAAERKNIAAEEKEANTRYKEEISDEIKKLQALKKRNETELKKIQEQLKTGDFAPPEKTPLLKDAELKKNFPKAWKEAYEARKKLIDAKEERAYRILKQQYEQRSKFEKTKDQVVRYLNVPRTIMASMDYSAPLRQAVTSTIAHPVMASKAFVESVKASFSQGRFDTWFHDLKESPRYDLMKDSKLSITDPHDLHLQAQEEAFMGNVAEKLPVVGKLIKGSERAYVSYLNKMRVDLFNRFADMFEENGRTFDNSPELYKGLATWINNSTGRGDLGFLESAAPVLNSFLFAPRLIASRFNMLLNPFYYAKLPKEIRVEALKDMLKFIAAGTTVLALAKLNGADVEDDPRSSDFGKIRSGNTRWDIWGGFQPYVRVLTQFALAQRKSTNTGKIYDLTGKGIFGKDRTDPLLTFGRGKLSPVAGMAVDLIKGRDIGGNKVTVGQEALQHFTPLLYSDLQQAMKDKGMSALFTVGIPSTFGVGVQTYTPTMTKPIKQTNSRTHRELPKREVREHR